MCMAATRPLFKSRAICAICYSQSHPSIHTVSYIVIDRAASLVLGQAVLAAEMLALLLLRLPAPLQLRPRAALALAAALAQLLAAQEVILSLCAPRIGIQ